MVTKKGMEVSRLGGAVLRVSVASLNPMRCSIGSQWRYLRTPDELTIFVPPPYLLGEIVAYFIWCSVYLCLLFTDRLSDVVLQSGNGLKSDLSLYF